MNLTKEQIGAIIGVVVLGIITIFALIEGGLGGFLDGITHSWATIQIYVDLVIAILFLIVWMWRDAKTTGRNPWPWIVLALIIGSFSPLIYLLLNGDKAK